MFYWTEPEVLSLRHKLVVVQFESRSQCAALGCFNNQTKIAIRAVQSITLLCLWNRRPNTNIPTAFGTTKNGKKPSAGKCRTKFIALSDHPSMKRIRMCDPKAMIG